MGRLDCGDNFRPEEAKGRVGETATVCGMVACAQYEANEQSQPTLLDLGKPMRPSPRSSTRIIALRGNPICVTGQISDYQASRRSS